MQKNNLITQFFDKILQRISKLAILGSLGMPGHTHLKLQYLFEETFDVYLQTKTLIHPSRFPRDIATCYFWTFGIPGYVHPN